MTKTKKKLKLKESVKEKLIFLIIILVDIVILIGLNKIIKIETQHEYERAIERCGTQENVIEKRLKDGTTYFTCK